MSTRGSASLPLLLVAALTAFTAARETSASSFGQGRVGLSLNYPGVGARVCALDFMPVEARAQYEPGIAAVGVRISRRVLPVGRSFAYYGLEYAYLSFDTDIVQGRGNFGSAFVGVETFIRPDRVSFEFDFGPSYLWMRDRGMAVSVTGMDYVLNFGLSYYFGGKKEER